MQIPTLILGASGTIGGAICQRLYAEGHSVLLHGNSNITALKALSQTCGNAETLLCDLTDETSVIDMFANIKKRFGALRAIIFAVAKPFPHKLTHRTKWFVFQEQLDSQIKAAHFCCTHAQPMLKSFGEKETARVLIIGTEYTIGQPPIKAAPYVAAKAALEAYAKIIAKEWLSANIRLHILAPGMVRSNMTADLPELYLDELVSQMPEKRFTSPTDIANVAAFLLSSDSDSLYGTVIPVSRGPRRC